MNPPATVGQPLAQVDTPALILDLDAFERNLKTVADLARGRVRVRAHAKTGKCPEVAKRQMALGAVGVCCQKVSEAEAMVEGGIADVLVSNEVVGEAKIERLARLAARARIGVCVDDAGNVLALEAATRCGCFVFPGGAMSSLARLQAILDEECDVRRSHLLAGRPAEIEAPRQRPIRAPDEHRAAEAAAAVVVPQQVGADLEQMQAATSLACSRHRPDPLEDGGRAPLGVEEMSQRRIR